MGQVSGGIYGIEAFVYCFAAVLAMVVLTRKWTLDARFVKLALVITALGSATALLICMGLECSTAVIADHFEPTVMATSYLWTAGQPIYHDIDAAPRYSVLYGPTMYLAYGAAFATFGPGIVQSQIVSCCLALASLALVWRAIGRETGPWIALACTTQMALFLLFDLADPATFYRTRCEPHVLFWMACALWAARIGRPGLGAILTGAALGMLGNTKASLFVMALPIVALAQWRRARWSWALCVVAATITFFAPFLASENISFQNYLAWLRLAGRHRLSIEVAAEFIQIYLFLATPLFALGLTMFASLPAATWRYVKNHWMYVGAFAVALTAIGISASKIGSGDHHVLPFVPLMAFTGAKLWTEYARMPISRGKVATLACALGGTYAVVLVLWAASFAYDYVFFVRANEQRVAEIQSDLQRASETYAGKPWAVGYGGDQSYRTGIPFYRVSAVFSGQPYLLDAGALMDMQQSGLAIPAATLEALARGRIEVWLLPKDEIPFSMHSWYDPKRLVFDQQFRDTFQRYYRKSGATRFFDVWTMKGQQTDLHER